MADQSAAIKAVEMDKKIKKVINRKYSKTQVVEKPFFLDEHGMDAYHKGFMAVLKVMVGLAYIPIILIAGVCEAIEVRFLAGCKKVVRMCEEFLNDRR